MRTCALLLILTLTFIKHNILRYKSNLTYRNTNIKFWNDLLSIIIFNVKTVWLTACNLKYNKSPNTFNVRIQLLE